MKFDVGKEYVHVGIDKVPPGSRVRVEAVNEWGASLLFLTGPFAGEYGAVSHVGHEMFWRPYVPAPEPVVRFVYARMYSRGEPGIGAGESLAEATGDNTRVGPVVRVELPVTPKPPRKVVRWFVPRRSPIADDGVTFGAHTSDPAGDELMGAIGKPVRVEVEVES